MVKRKRTNIKSRSRKKSKRNSLVSFIVALKQLGISALIAVIVLLGILFLYKFFFVKSSENTDKSTEVQKEVTPAVETKTPQKEPINSKVSASSTKTFHIPAGTEIPVLKSNQSEQIIKHDGYTVSYNSDYKIANWVAYELTRDEALSKKTERSNKFVPDPMVTGATALNEDYSKTGFDRGHLAPAGDMKWSAKAMRESFYFSNITPQKPGLNRGIWKDLEEQARMWAADNGSLLIVTGPVIDKNLRRLGKNRVGIPERFYKVIVYHTGKNYEGIGFLFDNKDYKTTLIQNQAVPIDSIEKVTNIDFFPLIPDNQEEEMESKVNWKRWSF